MKKPIDKRIKELCDMKYSIDSQIDEILSWHDTGYDLEGNTKDGTYKESWELEPEDRKKLDEYYKRKETIDAEISSLTSMKENGESFYDDGTPKVEINMTLPEIEERLAVLNKDITSIDSRLEKLLRNDDLELGYSTNSLSEEEQKEVDELCSKFKVLKDEAELLKAKKEKMTTSSFGGKH